MIFALIRFADVFIETKIPLEQAIILLTDPINTRHSAIACTVAAVSHQQDERMEKLSRTASRTSAARSMTWGT